jgi:hypothetical protein
MQSLLPDGSGLFERAFEQSWEQRWPALDLGADAIRGAKFNPPPSYLPFLVYEYGLGELTPYVPNLYTLVVGREGVNWQRVRGTPAAVYKGLGWLGYTATLEDAWHGRAYWNSTQLRFPALPNQDFPDLEQIEGVTRLSLPKRSQLRRGVHQYDVGPAIGNASRLNGSLLERESGTRLRADGPLWSFGRTTEIDYTLTEAEGTAIGNWLDIPEGGGLAWIDMDYPWATADFAWADDPLVQRSKLMAAWFAPRSFYVRLKNGEGDIIGYRRCRANRPVTQAISGPYRFGNASYRPASNGQLAYVEAMTQFGDADGVVAASVALVSGVTLAAGVKPGTLWLQPAEVTSGIAFAETVISLPLRTTVRERFKFFVRF